MPEVAALPVDARALGEEGSALFCLVLVVRRLVLPQLLDSVGELAFGIVSAIPRL